MDFRMAAPTLLATPINPFIQSWITYHRVSINEISKTLGIDGASIAMPLAQEASTIITDNGRLVYKRPQDILLDSRVQRLTSEQIDGEYQEQRTNIMHGTVNNDNRSKLNNAVPNDIGLGNINVGVALLTLERYANNPDFQLDPLGLRKYIGNSKGLS